MTVIKKADVPTPVLPKETVEGITALGGDVIVRGLLLTERLAFKAQIARDQELAATPTVAAAVMERVPQLLALCVVDADGAAIWPAATWDEFGARHEDDALRLFNVAMRLSGFGAEDSAKNSPASPT